MKKIPSPGAHCQQAVTYPFYLEAAVEGWPLQCSDQDRRSQSRCCSCESWAIHDKRPKLWLPCHEVRPRNWCNAIWCKAAKLGGIGTCTPPVSPSVQQNRRRHLRRLWIPQAIQQTSPEGLQPVHSRNSTTQMAVSTFPGKGEPTGCQPFHSGTYMVLLLARR